MPHSESANCSTPQCSDREALERLDKELAELRLKVDELDPLDYEEELEETYYRCFSVLRSSNQRAKAPVWKNAKTESYEVYSKPGYMRIEFEEIIRQTAKAVLVKILGGKVMWFPKSVLSTELVGEKMLLVKDWFVSKEGVLK